VPGSWRIELGCWTIEFGWSFKVAGGLPSLPTFENPSLEEDNPGSVTCEVCRRGVALCEFVGSCCVHTRLLPRCSYSWVTCYPVCHCGRHGDIYIFYIVYLCDRVCVYKMLHCVRVVYTNNFAGHC